MQEKCIWNKGCLIKRLRNMTQYRIGDWEKNRSLCFIKLQWQQCDWNGTYLSSKIWAMKGCSRHGVQKFMFYTLRYCWLIDSKQVISFTYASVLFLHNRNVQLPQNDWNFHVSIALPCKYDSCRSLQQESWVVNAFHVFSISNYQF